MPPQPQRLSGINASVFLQGSSTKLLDAYFWEYEELQEVLDASIKGERFKRYTADVGTGRVRIQSFVSKPGSSSPLTSIMNSSLVTSAGGGTPIDFVLHMLDGHTTIVGQGYIIRSMLHVIRDGIVTDEIEIQVDGQPATVN